MRNSNTNTQISEFILGKEYIFASIECIRVDRDTVWDTCRYRVVLEDYDHMNSVCNIRILDTPLHNKDLEGHFLWRKDESIAVYASDLEELSSPGSRISYRGTLPEI